MSKRMRVWRRNVRNSLRRAGRSRGFARAALRRARKLGRYR